MSIIATRPRKYKATRQHVNSHRLVIIGHLRSLISTQRIKAAMFDDPDKTFKASSGFESDARPIRV